MWTDETYEIDDVRPLVPEWYYGTVTGCAQYVSAMVAGTDGMAEYAATAMTLSDTCSLPSMSKSLFGTSKTWAFHFIAKNIDFTTHALLDW